MTACNVQWHHYRCLQGGQLCPHISHSADSAGACSPFRWRLAPLCASESVTLQPALFTLAVAQPLLYSQVICLVVKTGVEPVAYPFLHHCDRSRSQYVPSLSLRFYRSSFISSYTPSAILIAIWCCAYAHLVVLVLPSRCVTFTCLRGRMSPYFATQSGVNIWNC